MRAITAFQHLMPDTVTYRPFTGRDSYGDPTYGSSVTYPAKVVGRQQVIRGFSGLELVSRQTVYLGAASLATGVFDSAVFNPLVFNAVTAAIIAQSEDQITLSTGLVASTQASAISPPILGAKRIPDQHGLHSVVLYLGG